MKTKLITIFCCLCLQFSTAQVSTFTGLVLDKEDGKEIQAVSIYINELDLLKETDKSGQFKFDNIPYGQYVIEVFVETYYAKTIQIDINQVLVEKNIFLEKFNEIIAETKVTATNTKQSKTKLNNVEQFGLYGAKKTEVIPLDALVGNVAVNNPRQVFKTIAGLNIHENDGAGLQLSIGGRGLDPNRTANFNTRQNGYDISADALGYPESYYTPPVQALQKIEIVRGAASLQFGSQFGGLLNFVFKEGTKDKPFSFLTENTYGSNNLFTTFNAIGGSYKKINYYGFYNYKRGHGFRPSSAFNQQAAFAKINYDVSDKFKIGIEFTYMNYLSQQPGGLQDFEFNENPYMSKRQRNWFSVNWNLGALHATYEFNKRTRINTRNFVLSASRNALGELAPINRPDPLRERDLVIGNYQNFGNETRFLHQYTFRNQLSTFLIGTRFYNGLTKNLQGDASDGRDADFNFITTEPNVSSFEFPSRNLAFFAENLFNINDKWSVTPGLRMEYIKTASDGYLYQRIFSSGEIIYEEKIEDKKENIRNILLLGLGSSYRLRDELEVYANFSQNYRSINFTDLAIQNPNLVVDSLLQDEKGYNFDLGLRGELLDGKIQVDATLFALRYNNRIGLTDIIVEDEIGVQRVVDFRTNVGDALILGIETYIETDVFSFFTEKSDFKCLIFSNLSFIQGTYLTGGSDIEGNKVELIPPVNFKTGLTFQWKNLRSSFLYSFNHWHYSDATNAEFVANATRGSIPSYSILDLSLEYKWQYFTVSTGINNLGNTAYFTRRTSSYPGPGIIPAQGRNAYISVKFEW